MCVILDSMVTRAKMCSTKQIPVMKEVQEAGEDIVDGKEIDERTIKEVAANLRIIGDEINAKYTRLTFRNIVTWIRILRIMGKIWI